MASVSTVESERNTIDSLSKAKSCTSEMHVLQATMSMTMMSIRSMQLRNTRVPKENPRKITQYIKETVDVS